MTQPNGIAEDNVLAVPEQGGPEHYALDEQERFNLNTAVRDSLLPSYTDLEVEDPWTLPGQDPWGGNAANAASSSNALPRQVPYSSTPWNANADPFNPFGVQGARDTASGPGTRTPFIGSTMQDAQSTHRFALDQPPSWDGRDPEKTCRAVS